MPAEIVPQILYGAVLLFMLGAIGALWHRMGNIQQNVGRLDANVATLQTALNEKTGELRVEFNSKIDDLRTETDEKFAAANAKTDALQASVNDLKDTMVEMQLQMQRNHYQIMMAVLSHSHRADGRPVFDLPPDIEPPEAGE